MAEYYKESFSSRNSARATKGTENKRHNRSKPTRKGHISWWLIVDFAVLLTTLLLATTTLTIIVMQYIQPHNFLSVITLSAPIVYIFDIIVALYWILRWRWRWAVFSLLIVGVASWYLPDYYKITAKRQYNTPYVERHFTKVVSYNVANRESDEMVEFVASLRPNIVCLQEFLSPKQNWNNLGSRYNTTFKEGDRYTCEIYTTHKILRNGRIKDLPPSAGVWADLRIGDDTVRVINLHLHSTTISQSDRDFIEEHEYIFDEEREGKIRGIIKRLTTASVNRAQQAEVVRQFIDETPYKMVVCGDFNDVPLSYAYRHISKGLNSTFREAGVGYSHTFNGFFSLMQIDHILVSPQIETISYEVADTLNYSDHHPIVTRIKFENKEK